MHASFNYKIVIEESLLTVEMDLAKRNYEKELVESSRGNRSYFIPSGRDGIIMDATKTKWLPHSMHYASNAYIST